MQAARHQHQPGGRDPAVAHGPQRDLRARAVTGEHRVRPRTSDAKPTSTSANQSGV